MPFHPEDGDEEQVSFLKEHETNIEADYEFYMVLIQPYNELENASKLLHKKGIMINGIKTIIKIL